jgi:hypothetical protein
MKNIKAQLLVLSVVICFFNSCMVAEHDVIPECEIQANGLSRAINNLVSEEILSKIIDLGMPINTGGVPPKIDGNSYKSAPMILKATNIAGESPGSKVNDSFFTFSEQNNANLTIKIDFKSGTETGTGIGSYMAGSGDNFTIFSQVDVEDVKQVKGIKSKTVFVISGTWTPTGIKDLHNAVFMLDDKGDPNGIWIEVGQGRIFYDSDGFSEKL